jgi:hypothetical protein
MRVSDPNDAFTSESPTGSSGESGQQSPALSSPLEPSPPGATTATMLPPTPRKNSWRGLWIALAVAAVLVGLLGGGAIALAQYLAPATTTSLFCAYLKTQRYAVAYSLLSSTLRRQLTHEAFVQGSAELDKVEGAVTTCGPASGTGAYSFRFGSSTAAVKASITRAIAGTLAGTVHLQNENGSWKIDRLDTSLLGADLGALQAARAYCMALQTQNYTAAYALLGNGQQNAVTRIDFAQAAQARDAIDGPVNACGLAGLGPGNTDTIASLIVTITRGKLGERQGKVTLDMEGGAWKVAGVAQALQGSDLGPLQVAQQLCQDVMRGALNTAYQDLGSTSLKSNVTETQFAVLFQLDTGQAYASCTPNYATYKVSQTYASLDVTFAIRLSASGKMVDVTLTLYFVAERGTWKLDGAGQKP